METIYSTILTAYKKKNLQLQRSVRRYKCDGTDIIYLYRNISHPMPEPFPKGQSDEGLQKAGRFKTLEGLFISRAEASL